MISLPICLQLCFALHGGELQFLHQQQQRSHRVNTFQLRNLDDVTIILIFQFIMCPWYDVFAHSSSIVFCALWWTPIRTFVWFLFCSSASSSNGCIVNIAEHNLRPTRRNAWCKWPVVHGVEVHLPDRILSQNRIERLESIGFDWDPVTGRS